MSGMAWEYAWEEFPKIERSVHSQTLYERVGQGDNPRMTCAPTRTCVYPFGQQKPCAAHGSMTDSPTLAHINSHKRFSLNGKKQS